MLGETGVTVVTMLVCLFYFACEAAGASSARHSLRPLIPEGGTSLATFARKPRRDREGMSVRRCLKCEAMTVFDPTPLATTVSTSPGVSAIVEPSSSAKADDPVFQSSCDEIERPRRTGSSGQARR